ncbi:hypothetical protein LF817_13210 [Halobacillus sp. A1]|uniref:hypothetical protein n=1 Tax=Halobacillus sp. A1 TaxID=2880262 RepID=UPI0020A63728|nr:hypothetical protein [Halobacillus sp. A1]MCP3032300.1 hypothetical protein [Halobacillus sp. A1]
MDETEWDIQEVKRLKKKRLVQHNISMLLSFVLFIYYMKEGGSAAVLLGLCCVFFWGVTVYSLYKLKTGKTIGTKTSRFLEDFERDNKGEKRWKRKNMIEAGLLSVLSIVFTVFLFVLDFGSARMDFPTDALPFIVTWVGVNIGEVVRINIL